MVSANLICRRIEVGRGNEVVNMNSMGVHFVARDRLTATAVDKSAVDTAWLVLEAALDLGDELAVAACRRVIDASLTGAVPMPDDLHVVLDYFR